MSKHVPGPWIEAGQAVYAQTPQKINHLRVSGADEKETVNGEEVGYLVAESIWCADTRRLIAAAPDLLTALDRMVTDFGDVESEDMDGDSVIGMARDALAKAKGEI